MTLTSRSAVLAMAVSIAAAIGATGCQASATPSAQTAELAPFDMGDLQRESEESADSTDRNVARPSQQTPRPLPGGAEGLAPLESELLDSLSVTTSTYDLRPGETLRAALTRWTQDAGWQLIWQSSKDYKIEAGMTFPRGTTLKQAVRETVYSVWMANPTLKAELYKNNVLVITETQA